MRDPSIWESKKPKLCPHCGMPLSARRITTEVHVNFYCSKRPADAEMLDYEQLPDNPEV